jgi:hypothetical protein
MRAVRDHSRSLVEDPDRLDGVAALALDETSFLRARTAPTRWITGLVALEGGPLLDVVADRTRATVDGWLGVRPDSWPDHIAMVALDPWRGYASALTAPLGHARADKPSEPRRRYWRTADLGTGPASSASTPAAIARAPASGPVSVGSAGEPSRLTDDDAARDLGSCCL